MSLTHGALAVLQVQGGLKYVAAHDPWLTSRCWKALETLLTHGALALQQVQGALDTLLSHRALVTYSAKRNTLARIHLSTSAQTAQSVLPHRRSL